MAFVSASVALLHPRTSLQKTSLGSHPQRVRPSLWPNTSKTSLCMVATTPSKQPSAPSSAVQTYDAVVIGGGPAGLSIAAALGKRGVTVLCADLTLDKQWPNNYGTWVDELEPLGLADCTSHQWRRTAAFVNPDGTKSELDRAYCRVDRTLMKERLLRRCSESGNVVVLHAAAQTIDSSSDPHWSFVSLNILDSPQKSQKTVAGSIIVDATGHDLRFVEFQPGKPPGYQAAYGIECIVSDKGFPYDAEEMLLMDYRDDHMQSSQSDRQKSQKEPTFVYVMPLDNGQGRQVFFEETSLVASPAMDFDELKERLYKRLDYYGIEVCKILDEEYCLIPMGGEMPKLRQRIVAFGGAAALVHPATGYMIARALKLADDAAEIITQEIQKGGSADEKAYRIWDRIWNIGRQRQRDFFNYGGEFLMKIDLETTRSFFSAFFKLPTNQWSAFLSFKLVTPVQRLVFGLGVFVRATNRLRAQLVTDAIAFGRLPLAMSVLPLYKSEEKE